jgi:hypothetical protein
LENNYINDEFHNLYSSPSIIKIIKSERMNWAWNVIRIEENNKGYRIFVEKLEGSR